MASSTTTKAGSPGQGRPPRNADPGMDDAQLKRLLGALTAMRDGNFRKRLPVTGSGLAAELAAAYNEIAERQQHLTSELGRVQRVAGREGKHSERLHSGAGEGDWARAIESANDLVSDLVRPVSEMA